MQQKFRLSTFRIGTPARRNQGLRIAVTRRPTRGISKERWVTDGYFDVWFPLLAPSAALLSDLKRFDLNEESDRKKFFDRYERQVLANLESRQAVDLLVHIAMRTSVSIGCYCDDESRCHRSRLLQIIERHYGQLRR